MIKDGMPQARETVHWAESQAKPEDAQVQSSALQGPLVPAEAISGHDTKSDL